jgi:arylsulfatase A-like enzyme
LLVRATLLIERGAGLSVAEPFALLADLALAGVAAALLGLIQRWTRVAAVALAALWGAFNYANYEHVTALGAPLNLAFAGYVTDGTFLAGSFLTAHSHWLLGATVLGSAALVGGAVLRGALRGRWPLIALGAAAVLLGAHLLAPDLSRAVAWRQSHFLVQNLRWSLAAAELEPSDQEIPGLFPGSLAGRPFIGSAVARPNVLLVVLEGVSGTYLPSNARAQGVESTIEMPRLDALARDHVNYRSFVVHQRQTNRGEYALLCGDLPALTTETPKMSAVAGFGRGRVDCLPWALRDRGYLTAYLQAAPLEFMSKDRFMRLIGFERIHGREWFSRAYQRGAWGPDDRAFLEQSLDLIDELGAQPRPWFLTLLTVGTHHPYTVPSKFESPYEQGSFGRAIDYLDRAVGEFHAELARRGVLEDTLVLFTSDEAFVPKQDGGELATLLGQLWAPMVALVPGGVALAVDEPHAQVDVPLSLLDFVGAPEAAAGFGGRSMFRRHGPRPLPFGNVHLHRVGALLPDGDLLVCREDLGDCTRYTVPDGRRFAAAALTERGAPADPERRQWMEDVAERSLAIRVARERARHFRLADPTRVAVPELPSERIFGGQYLTVPARTRIEVELVVANRGSGPLPLMHFLWRPAGTLWSRHLELAAGERAVLRYSYRTDVELHKLTCNLKLKDRRPKRSKAVLDLEVAEMQLVPLGDAPFEPGVEIHEWSVSGPPAADAGADGGR